MARKQPSHPGDPASRRLRVAALVVAAAVAVLAAAYWPTLRWAARELPLYGSAEFHDPPEREMLLEALELLDADPASPRAVTLLRDSAAIDPNGEASYWLARLAGEAGRPDDAVAGLSAWLRIDSRDVRAWLDLARFLDVLGRRDEATRALVEARDLFGAEAELHRPHLVPERGVRANRKAQQVHDDLVESLHRIEEELASR